MSIARMMRRTLATGLLACLPLWLAGCASREPVPETPMQALVRKAEAGDAIARKSLGAAYFSGNGVAKDDAEGLKWTRLAAEQGELDASVTLGMRYLSGLGVTRDYAEAQKWFRLAADRGNAGGQYWLGVIYENGYGVAQDFAEAAAWYRRAADQNLPQALDALYALRSREEKP